MNEYFEILIAALEYFDKNRSATKYDKLPDYSKEDLLSLVYLTIREIPSFEHLTEAEFARLPYQTDIQILKDNQNKVSQTVPANLESIVENYNKREIFQADTKAITKWVEGLKKESRFRNLLIVSESDPEPLDTEESKKIVSEIKADLAAELEKDTTKKDFSNLEITKTFAKIIKNQAASTGVTLSDEQAVKISVPYLEYINSLEGEEIADRLSVEKIKAWVANPQEISVGNLLAFEAVEPERVVVRGFWASPISTPVKAVIKMGVEEIAKKNPAEATALVLRANNVSSARIHEMRLLAQSMGVSLQQWDLLESSLKTVRNLDSSGWISALNNARIAGIDEATAQALFANQRINFQAVAPQHNFLGGIVYRMGQQAFSKISANFIQGSINKVAGVAAKKVAGKVAATAAGKVVAAVTGTIPVIGPFVSWLAGKAVEFFATKILPWIKKNLRWILVGGGALIGGLVAGLGGALAGGALGAFAAGGGTIAGGITVISAGIAALVGGTIGAIVVPLIIALIGIPISVALIAFIINSGAYVLPPGPALSLTVGPSNVTPSACPLPGGRQGDGSYYSGVETTGHGSTNYWRKMGARYCRWALPETSGCMGPTNAGNVCSGESKTCDYYGFALDIFPTQTRSVYAPEINGEETDWRYGGVRFVNGPGGVNGESILFVDSSGKYALLLTHIAGAGVDLTKTYHSGDMITGLYDQGTNTHLHIELQVNGIYQRPEDYFKCG